MDSPLDVVLRNALDLGIANGYDLPNLITHLTVGLDGKENRYKWRKKLLKLASNPKKNINRCELTIDFIKELEL